MIVVLLGFCAVLAASAVGVSLFAVWRTQASMALVEESARQRCEELQAALSALQKTVEGHSVQFEDFGQQPAVCGPAVPRSGLNLGKRSQVLRLHRNGEGPDRIAATLDIPRQEVELLLKVHRIVIGRL